ASNKAPGPDGFSFAFIKNYWDLIKTDIFEFVNSFFDSGLMPQGLHGVMSNTVNSGLIRDIKLGSSDITLSHLFYADDVVITSEWNSGDLDNVIWVLHVFHLASGLKINI
nr:RNA-directed DNA polymerase, eukaryota [Tanacetum cinerariifolium]